jgi:hypothetical protein
MAKISVGGLTYEYEPGQTYLYPPQNPPGDPEPTEEEKERSRADARAQAVKQFQKVASGSTLEAIEQTVQVLFAQLIQFRALNGTAAGHPLPAQLREAADYLEDL